MKSRSLAPALPVYTRKSLVTWTVIVGSFILGLLRIAGLAYDAAVNVPYADQWDFLTPLFNDEGPWACFWHQHGPHRQGVGGLLQWMLYSAASWDVRAETWCSVLLLALSAVAATVLAIRLRGQPSSLDAIIPLVILSPLHWETLLFTTNISHSILPLGLLLFLSHALLSRSTPWKPALIGLIGAACIFTGFGFCTALATLVVLTVKLSPAYGPTDRRTNAIALALVGVGFTLFFIGYRWDPSIPGWVFPVPDWWNYGTFMSYMMATLIGLREKTALAAGVGGILSLVVAAIFFTSLLRLWKGTDTHRSTVIALLTGTSLVYAALTACGRLPINIEAAFMWRYTTLMMPAALGVILHLESWIKPLTTFRICGWATFGILILGFAIVCNLAPERLAPTLAAGKRRWIQAYLLTHDADQSNTLSSFSIYPQPKNPPRIIERLRWLEANHLSFFTKTRAVEPASPK